MPDFDLSRVRPDGQHREDDVACDSASRSPRLAGVELGDVLGGPSTCDVVCEGNQMEVRASEPTGAPEFLRKVCACSG